MRILSFESSCDETSTAVLEFDDKGKIKVLSNIVASQIEIHARYGGVVPEIASRAHTEAISKITYEALEKAGVGLDGIDAIAVTAEPGLIGALLVGVNFAKSLAFSYGIPLVPVNHMRGHIAANYITNSELHPPFIAMIASGGHTSIVRVDGYRDMTVIGSTRDDAIGEAFDKVARVMGMPYPGGAALDRLAYTGKTSIKFPTAAIRDDTLDFSFSGIKTAVLNYINSEQQKHGELPAADIAASFTDAVVTSVISKLDEAFKRNRDMRKLALAGGVAANSHLRAALTEFCTRKKIEFFAPELCYCGDNAAMIGAAGYFEYLAQNFVGTELNASAVSEI